MPGSIHHETGDITVPEFDNVQITEDLSVNGQVDLGNNGTAKFSLAGDYIEVAGVPLGTAKGILLKPTSTPSPSSEGAILYLSSADGRVSVVLPNGHHYPLSGF
jgi:hypothetical protein